MQNNKKRAIRIQAEQFRERCKVSRYGILDLFGECKRMGYQLLRYPLGEDGVLGFTMKKDNDIIVFTNSSSRLSREIFTLAHEIGHVVLHAEYSHPFIDDAFTLSGRNCEDKEQEANYFAACLLMPDDEVNRFLELEVEEFEKTGLTSLDVARMMSEFRVSFDMVLNRLENLRKITSGTRIRLDSQKNQASVRKLLRCVGGNRRLNEGSDEIDLPYEYIYYTIYNYNHGAIPLETLERVLRYYHLSLEDVRDRLHDQPEEKDDLDELIGGLTD